MKLFFLLLLTVSCTPKIHEAFKRNSYSTNYDTQVFNDSLKLSFKSPADVNYTTSKQELKKLIRSSELSLCSDILFHGVTRSPEYEFFVTISNVSAKGKNFNHFKFDTLIGNNIISFIGKPVNERWEKPMIADINNMIQSLQTGEGYNQNKPSVFDVVNKYNKSINFYAALEELTQFPAFDKNDEWMKLQMELTFASMLGENDIYLSLLSTYEAGFEIEQENLDIIKLNSLRDSEVIEKILDEANRSKLVMLNENHFYPNHRILLIQLLPKLKEIGYTKLAIEALYPGQDSVLNQMNSFPDVETGFYIKEQNFGNLIRLAKELEFEFIEYENYDSTQTRELGQAENLYNKTFGIDSNSKVIVLAGIDHILEKETSNGKRWLANEFKEKYAINPITISQTHLNNYRHNFSDNYVLIEGNRFKSNLLSSVDFHVINNTFSSAFFDCFFPYKNDLEEDVQICLFVTEEMGNPAIPYKNIPYFTTMVKSGEKIKLPFYGNKSISILTYDRNGTRTNIGTKTPPNIN